MEWLTHFVNPSVMAEMMRVNVNEDDSRQRKWRGSGVSLKKKETMVFEMFIFFITK